jgi:hypothetical protein
VPSIDRLGGDETKGTRLWEVVLLLGVSGGIKLGKGIDVLKGIQLSVRGREGRELEMHWYWTLGRGLQSRRVVGDLVQP